MNTPEKLTIVMCTYNGSRFLQRSIPAVLSQNGLEKYVYSFIVVDNASNDNTKEIIESYAACTTMIKYVYEHRQGLAFARMAAVAAETEWVLYIDDDNILDENFVREIAQYICEHPKTGALNGINIALPEEELNAEDKATLKAVYTALACSYWREEDYRNCKKSRLGNAVGAGMAVRTSVLRDLYKEGWTKNNGRTGEKLGSGEDGEIIRYVLSKTFEFAVCQTAVLFHVIPKARLSAKYLEKLYSGLAEGYSLYQKCDGQIVCLFKAVRHSLIVVSFLFAEMIMPKELSVRMKYIRMFSVYRLRYLVKSILFRS